MYFFVNTILPERKTGIEHAGIKRVKLFKDNGKKAKIVVRNFDRTVHHFLKDVDLVDDDIQTMFDFFQKTSAFKARKFTIESLPKFSNQTVNEQEATEKNHYEKYQIFSNNQLAAKVFVFKWDKDQINSVTYYDQYGNKVSEDLYDSRGFLTDKVTLGVTKRVAMEEMFTPDGRGVYKSYYHRNKSGVRSNSALRVIDYEGQGDYTFTGLKGFTRFFFDELNKSTQENNVYLIDRNYDTDWAILNMKTKVFKMLQLHNVQSDAKDVKTSRLNYNYEYGLNHDTEWNGVVALGPTQQRDVKKRFKDANVYAIGGGVVSQELMDKRKLSYRSRTAGKVVVVARLSNEKKIDKAIKAFSIAHQKLPNITMDIYGHGKEKEKLEKLVNGLKLADAVTFKGYVSNISEVYDKAMVSVLSSDVEGLPLGLIEAQSHGLPIIARDVVYGPNDIIKNGVDGFLIKPNRNDIANFAEKMVELLSDKELWTRMSKAAYKNREQFSAQSMWAKWQQVDADVNKFYGEEN